MLSLLLLSLHHRENILYADCCRINQLYSNNMCNPAIQLWRCGHPYTADGRLAITWTECDYKKEHSRVPSESECPFSPRLDGWQAVIVRDVRPCFAICRGDSYFVPVAELSRDMLEFISDAMDSEHEEVV